MFEIDGKLWRLLNKMTQLMTLNLLFIFFSLPIFTIGAAKTALNDIARKVTFDEEESIIASYYTSFKSHFNSATMIWALYLLGLVIVSVNMFAILHLEPLWYTALFMMASTVIFILLNATFTYAILLNLHFRNTLKNTLINGVKLTIAGLPRTLLILLLELTPLFLLFFFTDYFLYIFTFYFVIGFSLTSSMISKVFEKTRMRLIK